jgi:heme/copper-type cytochrome/quinol oxidase subunit 3
MDEKTSRKMEVKHKVTGETFEILLDHNSFILFSTSTNEQYVHKIISTETPPSTNKWIGLTLRFSKTFVKFENGEPYLIPDNKKLTLATEQQKKDFYKYKSLENTYVGFSYPEINYTLSLT